jgi:hypothetical protein
MIEFTCPDCRKRAVFQNQEAGLVTRCAGCNAYVKVPPLACELPVARSLKVEFYVQCAILTLMLFAWAVPCVLLLLSADSGSPYPISLFLILLALLLTVGSLYVVVILPRHRRMLHHKFLSLGRLTGKTMKEIVVVAGEPAAYTEWDDETELLEWRANSYYLALVFRDGVCEGVQQEARVDFRNRELPHF